MTKPLNYPLEQMLTIKKNRFDTAVKILEEKKAILEKAYEKLYDLKQERDQVLQHKVAKLTQLRHELDTGTTTDDASRRGAPFQKEELYPLLR